MIRSPFLNEFLTLQPSTTRSAAGYGRVPVQTVAVKRRVSPGSVGWATPLPIDVYASNDEAVILAALPGIHPDSLEVTVFEDTVTISGSVPGSRDEKDSDGAPVTWYVSEIARGALRRTIQLPFAIEDSQVEAQYANGMLRLTLPRHEATKPHRISVQVLSSPAAAELSSGDNGQEGFSAD